MVDNENKAVSVVANTSFANDDVREMQKSLKELMDNMDGTIYRLNLLCNRFEKDKDSILKEGMDIKDAVKALQTEIASFANMRGEIGKSLSEKVKQAAEFLAREANSSIREALRENVRDVAYRLDESARRTEEKLKHFYNVDKKRIIYMALAFIVMSAGAVYLAAKLFIPTALR